MTKRILQKPQYIYILNTKQNGYKQTHVSRTITNIEKWIKIEVKKNELADYHKFKFDSKRTLQRKLKHNKEQELYIKEYGNTTVTIQKVKIKK